MKMNKLLSLLLIGLSVVSCGQFFQTPTEAVPPSVNILKDFSVVEVGANG